MGKRKVTDVSDMSDDDVQVKGYQDDEEYDQDQEPEPERQTIPEESNEDDLSTNNPGTSQEHAQETDDAQALHPQEKDEKKPKAKKPKKPSPDEDKLNLVGDCKEFMMKVAKCIDDDIKSNQKGQVALEKYKITAELCNRLKKTNFCELFLDLDGLDVLARFIGRLPDGSWPLSNVRQQILKSIYSLPVRLHHMQNTNLGGVLTSLLKSPIELNENKKLIQMITDKWTRIVQKIETEYVLLEECERATNALGKRYLADSDAPAKKKPTLDDYKTESRSYRSNHDEVPMQYLNPLRLGPGHNFCVRPSSNLQVATERLQKEESFREVERFLSKIRTKAKKNF